MFLFTFNGSSIKTPRAVPNTKESIQLFVFSGPNSKEYRNVKKPGTKIHKTISV